MLTWMSLAAADDAIVPVRTEPYDTMGVGLIIGTIGKIQRRLNPGLRLLGILPTQYNARKSVDREVLQHLCSMMKDRAPVLEPVPSSAVRSCCTRRQDCVGVLFFSGRNGTIPSAGTSTPNEDRFSACRYRTARR